LRALVRGAELDQRVGLVERQQVALAHFPDERLSGQRR